MTLVPYFSSVGEEWLEWLEWGMDVFAVDPERSEMECIVQCK